MYFSNIRSLQNFFSLNFDDLNKVLYTSTDRWWQEQGEEISTELFKKASNQVEGYKQFLKAQGVSPLKIKTYANFQEIPYTDKKNYIDQYPLEKLVWDGDLSQSFTINSSSGTTGAPYFWPNSYDQVVQGAIVKEIVYRTSFEINSYSSTLLIICFGMGTWIAGSFTYLTSQVVGQKGYPISIITPGFNKEETLKILERLSPKYEQTIIAGIPSFIKDLLEAWTVHRESKKINKIRFLFAGEGFSEDWRTYIMDLVANKNTDYLKDTVSILGSADAALMGFETPTSIYIRRLASKNKELCSMLFNSERVPALFNYIPEYRFFENYNNELLLSSDRMLPLLRYRLHEEGGVISSEKVYNILQKCGYDILAENTKNNNRLTLPFVYVFGRGKFTATIYGVNIYPEYVQDVLVDDRIKEFLTGRFTLETVYEENQDQKLKLNVELRESREDKKDLEEKISSIFIQKLRTASSEYKRMSEEYPERARPQVILYKYADKNLFPKDKIKKIS